MKIVTEIGKIRRKETRMIDIWYFLQGMMRYRVYYHSKLRRLLIREHVSEQIEYRVKVMNKECYNSGSCIKCGCMTTALQMCDKSCDGDCYPAMMDERLWNKFKKGRIITNSKNKTTFRYVQRPKDN